MYGAGDVDEGVFSRGRGAEGRGATLFPFINSFI
jgi:hypothetical protein